MMLELRNYVCDNKVAESHCMEIFLLESYILEIVELSRSLVLANRII